jgi:hypothetical protein
MKQVERNRLHGVTFQEIKSYNGNLISEKVGTVVPNKA